MRNFGVGAAFLWAAFLRAALPLAALLLVQGIAGCAAKDTAAVNMNANAAGAAGSTGGAGSASAGSSGLAASSGASGSSTGTASGGMPSLGGAGGTATAVGGNSAGGSSAGGNGGAMSPGGTSSGGDSTGLAGSGAGGVANAGGAAGSAGAAGSSQGGNAQGGASAGGRVNLALMQPATASSVEHAGHEPNMINDGDQVTRWVGGTAVYPQWNQIDLGAPHNVDTVIVWPYMLRAYQFLLEGSLDGVTYFTLADEQANTTGGDSIPVGFAAQSARYVRITITGASVYMDGWSAIDELEIYEAP